MVADEKSRTVGEENQRNELLNNINKELEEHERNKPSTSGNFSTLITPISEIEEKEPEWLIRDYIPRGGLTVLAGTGGDGKTTIWCAIAAAISSGEQTFIERALCMPCKDRKPEKVLCFSSEDSFECVLKRRLRLNGANLENIYHIPISDDRFREISFDSDFLKAIISEHKPALCIFDPIQGFVPSNIHMGDRNAMRSCLEPLIGYGDLYGTTFLIIVHTNKRCGAYGRDRMADSADVWDISRSVLMAGITDEDGVRYVSHEKSNYGLLGETVLYSIGGEVVYPEGISTKKDRDYVEEKMIQKNETKAAPAKEEAKEFIIEYLADGETEVSDLDSAAKAMSISLSTLKRAKADLKKDGSIKYRKESDGKGSGVKWYISATPREVENMD